MSNEVAFNSLEKDDVKITFEEPSRVPSKPTEKEVKQHRKTRLVLVALFGIIVLAMVVVAVIIIIVSPRCEPKKVTDGEDSGKSKDTLKADDSWWKHAVIYQVYPRSFFDKNDDGDGDLNGITDKLDYFGNLGADALWLNPIYDSPMADGGYDVSNYTTINKMFGTMEDFEKFLDAAHKKNLKVIMDFIPNHTSEKHPWFVESKASKKSSKRDWYIWRDGVTKDNKTGPPNNWISVFGGSAWEYDNATQQYYLHQFKKQQPDLNLRNPDVKNELKKVLQFWLGKKVDGFRFDAVQFLLEDDKFQDEPQKPNYNASDLKYDMLDHKFTNDLDGDRELVKEFQDVVNNGSRHLLIVEVEGTYKRTSLYFEEADIPFNFGLISKVKRDGKTLAQGVRDTVKEYLEAVPEGKTPNWVIGNHDVDRVGSRVGVGADKRNPMNVLLLTLPGVVTTYYGEEIGMLNGDTVKYDPRDKERTPMQWSAEANAGFSTKTPWLPVASDYKTTNVETEKADAKSFYNNYRKLVELRKEAAFASGDSNISGGQKARVALARSLMTPSDVVLLDDVLSAVDVHVATALVQDALLGALKESTRVVVANTFLPLLLPHAQQVLVLDGNGGVQACGPPSQVQAESPWLQEALKTMGSVAVKSQEDSTAALFALATSEGPEMKDGAQRDGSLLIAEDRNVGVLSFTAYASYFQHASSRGSFAVGAVLFGIVFCLALLAEAVRTFTEIWVTLWTSTDEQEVISRSDLVFWLTGYGCIVLAVLVIGVTRAVVFSRIVTKIGSGTFQYMLQKVLNASAPLFFDVVPAGRILNRFSKDLDAMDTLLPECMQELLTSFSFVVSSIVMCSMASHYAFAGLIPLCLMFAYIRRYYTASFRELQRMESVSRSPLYVHFSEVLAGLVHIRAFGLQKRLQESFYAKIDQNSRMYFHMHALVPFLVYRVNFLAASFIGIMTLIVILFHHQLDASLAGLALSASAGLVGRLHLTVKTSADVESNFTSVERLQHFKNVQQEASKEAKITAWPSKGKVVFENVQLRYRPHLPLVLRGVSFIISPGQRVGLVGRTGSGKSTLMLAFLRLVELSGGRVLLDDQDVSQVPLNFLRGHAVSIIPQDPFLFAGNLRDNLDPFGMSQPSQHLEALKRAGLEDLPLDTVVRSRGSNFSVGQRQLLCFARALLRQAPVVLLDEATANIDALTDAKVQQTLRTSFSGSTLLVIAHRLSTVADSDLLVCLSKGEVAEVGSPEELKMKGGVVAKMFADAGETMPGTRMSL